MHTAGAKVAKIVHPAGCPCDLPYIKVLIYEKKYAHTRCTGAKVHAPGSQNVHTGCRVHPQDKTLIFRDVPRKYFRVSKRS